MQVLIVIVSAGGVAFLGATTVFLLHRDGRVQHGPVHATARVVDHELAAHRGLATFVRERLDPRRATGLALTIALLLLVIVGVLAFEVRRQSFVVHADVDVARWAASHATDVSTRVLRDFTHLGSSVVILAI